MIAALAAVAALVVDYLVASVHLPFIFLLLRFLDLVHSRGGLLAGEVWKSEICQAAGSNKKRGPDEVWVLLVGRGEEVG